MLLQILKMEITVATEEMEVAPPKEPSKVQLLVSRCRDHASTIKTKVLSVLPGAEIFGMAYSYMQRFEFRQLHWFAFMLWSLISSFLFWVFQGGERRNSYLNCLFFAISSITDTGLATENVSSFNTFLQAFLCINFILGSAPLTGIVVLTVRKRAMEDAYGEIIENGRKEQQAKLEASRAPRTSNGEFSLSQQHLRTFHLWKTLLIPVSLELYTERPGNATDNGSSITIAEAPAQDPLTSSTMRKETIAKNLMVYWREFLSKATVGRNATFHGLSRPERESLVCVEYLAVILLRRVVTCYVVLFQLLGAIGLAVFFQLCEEDVIGCDGVNPIALGVFNSISVFNNAGMSLMNNSMVCFALLTFSCPSNNVIDAFQDFYVPRTCHVYSHVGWQYRVGFFRWLFLDCS